MEFIVETKTKTMENNVRNTGPEVQDIWHLSDWLNRLMHNTTEQTSIYIQQKDCAKQLEARLTSFYICQDQKLLFALEGSCSYEQQAAAMRQHWLESHPDLEKQSNRLKPNLDVRLWQQDEQVCLFNDKVFFTGTLEGNMDGWEQLILAEHLE